MKDLIFALVNPKSDKKDKTKQVLRELSLAWSRYGYHGDFIEQDCIDLALLAACETNARYCLIQSVGHVIDEQWFLPHWKKEGFYQGITRLIKTKNFLIAAELGAGGIKTDCFIVDLQRYRLLGFPHFGYANKSEKKISGWNLIRICQHQNLPIIKFYDAINDSRFDLSSYKGNSNRLVELIGQPVDHIKLTQNLNVAQSTFLYRIKKQLSDAKNGAFLFNIESYADLIQENSKDSLDALFSVAAGFKPYRILYTHGFHSQTQVIAFDYSKKALEIRQYIVENWDGVDFPQFIKQIFKRFSQSEVFYQMWYQASPDSLDWDDVEQLWQLELEKWGGALSFKQHWQKCCKLPHQYLHCDLLDKKELLLKEIARYDKSYIWWSNAFFTIFSHWYYSASERKEQYLQWIKALTQVSPNCQINGADHNNIAVNGLNAKQYYQKFDQLGCDLLIPQKINRIEISF